MNTKPLVIYHGNCPDGFGAAWAAYKALGDVELFAAKYGEEPPYDLARGRDTYVVDFSYPREKLIELCRVCADFFVLDHHKTAQAELEGLHYCTFDMGRSGAGIAWDHFHPGTARPWIVDYVEDRDLWRFSLPNSEEVSLAIRLTPHTLEAWDALAARSVPDVLVEARGAKLYLDHYVRDALRNAYFINDLYAAATCTVCVNVSYTGVSDVLNAALVLPVVNSRPVVMALGWHVAGDGDINCSLRSPRSFDCSGFAKTFGGGGHAQAAGFKIPACHPFAKTLLRQERL